MNTNVPSLVKINDNLPGIIGLLETFKDPHGTALRQLAEATMVKDSPLTREERETIAVFVSVSNHCEFCAKSHAAVVAALTGAVPVNIFFSIGALGSIIDDLDAEVLADDAGLTKLARLGDMAFPISLRMVRLMYIAHQTLNNNGIDRSVLRWFTDQEIHDAVLVAASFSMYNRYVNMLNPSEGSNDMLAQAGKRIAEHGYVR